MAAKSKFRLSLSQIEAEVIKCAGTLLEAGEDETMNGHRCRALDRALDKLALGLAGALGRDAERGVR